MATWNPENVVMTEKGRNILSKVQIGIGQIEVTRIVTGGQVVPYTDLSTLEAIPNEKQVCTILRETTDTQGSIVELSISNEHIQAAYSLYTLGVYVKHEYYGDEEVLYLVAECDIETPDLIPLPTMTVATMYYNLYIEHSNTENIVIEVDPHGTISKDLIGKAGGVAGLDETGKIPTEQLPDISADLIKGQLAMENMPESLQNLKAPVIGITTTAGDVAEKAVTVDGITALYDNLTLLLYIPSVNSAVNPMLKVNDLDAAPVLDKNKNALTVSNASLLGGLCMFMYIDGNFVLLDSMGSSNNLGAVKLSDSTSSTSGESEGVAATPAAVRAAYNNGTGKATKVLYNATIQTSRWVAVDSGYTQSITVGGILSSDTPVVGVVLTGDDSTDSALVTSWARVTRITTSNNTITAIVKGNAKPSVNLPIQLLCVR